MDKTFFKEQDLAKGKIMPALAYVKFCFNNFNKKFAQIICAKSKFAKLLSKIEI